VKTRTTTGTMDRNPASIRTTKYGITMTIPMITTRRNVVISDILGMMRRNTAGISSTRGGIMMTRIRITSMSAKIKGIDGMITTSAAMIITIIGGIIRIEKKG